MGTFLGELGKNIGKELTKAVTDDLRLRTMSPNKIFEGMTQSGKKNIGIGSALDLVNKGLMDTDLTDVYSYANRVVDPKMSFSEANLSAMNDLGTIDTNLKEQLDLSGGKLPAKGLSTSLGKYVVLNPEGIDPKTGKEYVKGTYTFEDTKTVVPEATSADVIGTGFIKSGIKGNETTSKRLVGYKAPSPTMARTKKVSKFSGDTSTYINSWDSLKNNSYKWNKLDEAVKTSAKIVNSAAKQYEKDKSIIYNNYSPWRIKYTAPNTLTGDKGVEYVNENGTLTEEGQLQEELYQKMLNDLPSKKAFDKANIEYNKRLNDLDAFQNNLMAEGIEVQTDGEKYVQTKGKATISNTKDGNTNDNDYPIYRLLVDGNEGRLSKEMYIKVNGKFVKFKE